LAIISRSTSPPIPIKPGHLKVKEKSPVEDDPFGDQFAESVGIQDEDEKESNYSGQNSVNQTGSYSSSSSSSTEQIAGNPRLHHVQSSPFLSTTVKSIPSSPENPFEDTKEPKVDQIPPKPILPPRPSQRNIIEKTYSASALAAPGLKSTPPSSSFPPPPLPSRPALQNHRINSIQTGVSSVDSLGSTSFKPKDDTIYPDTSKSYKLLPIPLFMSNADVYHKGPTRGYTFSGFYAITIGQSVGIFMMIMIDSIMVPSHR
jgi:hypothetical protein